MRSRTLCRGPQGLSRKMRAVPSAPGVRVRRDPQARRQFGRSDHWLAAEHAGPSRQGQDRRRVGLRLRDIGDRTLGTGHWGQTSGHWGQTRDIGTVGTDQGHGHWGQFVCCIRHFSTLTTLGTGCGAYALSSSRGVSTHELCTMKTISNNNQKASNGNQDVTRRLPITDHRSPITHHWSPITDHRSPITRCFLCV